MTSTIKLSERLKLVASYLPKGANFADIGSDHAYLPCYVCSKDPTAMAIAGEVNEGPYLSAKKTVTLYQFDEVIDVRLGDGLAVINPGEVGQVVISGMGGTLIRQILDDGKEKLVHTDRIITQPNVDEKSVREWFVKHGYIINHEEIIEENGHIYEVIIADKNKDGITYHLTMEELLFGPLLRKKKPKEFVEKWSLERDKRIHVLQQLKRAKEQQAEKVEYFEKELKMIEEVLTNG
ncbi:tRNA (adenine22-N1)-methyltransferase [Oceanobacillus limi]|uniref:tRNA (Adenine22-N1)-methyltransferase n=1 Tax=Oceanobacillus limi TaxID=930131 RepID=A0A1I0FS27_9BACI|nr:tRNA (adenine(22)-N(1))-methyltransferase TrmK [Oceanobacillus limi]SET61031.1 tRNA (adenine22-N1)-methyltransferase [Oceanobacillus limi]